MRQSRRHGWRVAAGLRPITRTDPPMIRVLVVLVSFLVAPNAWSGDEGDRLAFLEQRLDASQAAVSLWQDGWMAIYTSAAIGYAALAIDTDNQDDRTVRTIGAVRAAMAASLLNARPHPGRRGADPVRHLRDATPTERLAAAEAILRQSARRTEARRRPGRHLRNVLVNAGFGGLVWALGDKDDALPFTLLGIAGGEAMLLTLPRQPRRDLAEYRRLFGPSPDDARSWRVVPVPFGIRLQFALDR